MSQPVSKSNPSPSNGCRRPVADLEPSASLCRKRRLMPCVWPIHAERDACAKRSIVAPTGQVFGLKRVSNQVTVHRALSISTVCSNRPFRSAQRRKPTRSTRISLGVGSCRNSATASSANASRGIYSSRADWPGVSSV